jgi:ABC-2 type transport system ATP-binding protein
MTEPVIQIDKITKQYGTLRALDQVSFQMERNKIYGLLGRNGAGKTTLMHILTAQIFPTSGSMKVFGSQPYENNEVLRQICFIKESQAYSKTMKLNHVMNFASLVYPNWDQAYAESLLKDFGLPANRKMKQLSRGMLSAAGIVIGLASRAPLTIFDEPYLGLDAASRILFYDRLLEDYSENPRTIILSTHLIDEVNRLLEHVIIMDKGKIIIDEDADELREMAYTVTGRSDRMEGFIQSRKVLHSDSFGALKSMTILGRLDETARLDAEEAGLELDRVSLQQLFVHLTSGSQEAEKGGQAL